MDPCGLVDKFRDLVLNLIWEHLLYLVCYGQNIEELTKRLEKLTFERTSIQHRIDEARNNGEQIEENVLSWLNSVDGILMEAGKLLEKGQEKRECSLTSCPNPWLRYNLSKGAKAMAKNAVDIFVDGKFPRVGYIPPLEPIPELTNGESIEGIDSRVLIINQILEALQNPSVNVIGLCGLGGVGKTTIAKEIAKNQMFEKTIMATVSNKVDVERIQDQIAEQLGMQLDFKFEGARASRLHGRLKDKKNMLLILDDLWEELDLRKVGIPIGNVENYSKNNECCKILLTSRNEALLSKRMNCKKLIKVDFLSDDEAFKLFKRINAKLSSGSVSPELEPIATQIVQKCGGLPLAIATAAKALQEEDVDGWEDYLARWKNHLSRNITGIKEVDASLKLSYDPLSRENKNIFLLSGMLSHDPSVVDLLMYSVGLDFLQHTESMEQAHNGISIIIRKLKSLNLFLDSFSSYHFTIHDVFRDVALSIASDELFAFIVRHSMLEEWHDECRLERYKGIYLEESGISIELPEELQAPALQFFLFNSTKRDLTIPNAFFKSSKELKLLAFTNLHFSLLPSLSFLQKLKVLCLHSCVLEDIAGVGNLKKLKVLSLAYSEIEQLPMELAELTCLQMLNLSHCFKLKVFPGKLLSSYKKLEVLYMENSFNQWKVEATSEANENASLDQLKDLPISSLDIHIPNISMLPENLFLHMNLKRYRILIGEHWQWWQCNHESSKILRLELERGIHLKHGVQKLLERVEDLYLYGSNGLDNILFSDERREFPCLRHLQIENNDDIKCIVLNSIGHETPFPILESLVLKDLKALEKLCEGTNTISFDKLRILRMENLPALTADPYLKDGASNNESNKMFRSLFSKVLLPKLEILELCNLNNLIPFILDTQLSHNSLSKLRKLIVQKCGFVKLLPLHVLKSLNNLEELEIKECRMLKMVFDFEVLNDYGEIELSSVVVPLKKLKLWGLPKLENVWSSHYQGNISFPNLRSVDVCFCQSLTSIFPASFIVKGMLRDLEELQISWCGINAIVANDQASESAYIAFKFLRLTSLELHRLRKLKNFYPKSHTLEWPNLKRLCIEGCDELEIFEKEVSGSLKILMEESTQNSSYPLLSRDQVLHNLGELRLDCKHAEMIGSGLFPMYRFPSVNMLHLTVEEATISYKSLCKSFPNLEELELGGDFKVSRETDVIAASFSILILNNISNMRSLSPSLVSSQNLTHLQVNDSDYLTTLMTSTTAQCLFHLTRLSISSCYVMEEIITKHEGDNDEDKEIIFSKLKVLQFEDMPKLKRFCGYNYTFRFPLLEQIVMNRCPTFKIFSPRNIDTPSLKSVQLSKDWREQFHEIWDTNLDKTFYQQRFVASREMVLDKEDASMIRNDRFPVESCPEVEILGIEGFVDDEWVTVRERFPGLKELHVEDCSFEEIFPSYAPSLASFHNLIEVKVSKCHQLLHFVTNSTAKNLVNLETLEINDCEKMGEIVKKESSEDVERGGIIFKGLRKLKLDCLPRLKTEGFNIEDRAFGVSFRLRFEHNQVIPNLEELELRAEQAMINLLVPMYHFPKVKMLSLFLYDGSTISYKLLWKSFPNLEQLHLGGDFEEALETDDVAASFSTLTLKKISNRRCLSPSLVSSQNLTHLQVNDSNDLTTLMTSTTAQCLVHLTRLSISSCYVMEEIITKQEGENDEDKEIIFSKLKVLEFDNMSKLKRFCGFNYTFRFPLLEQIVMKRCPKFKIFSPGNIDAPSLKSLQLSKDWGEELYEIWDTNLDKTFYQQRFVASKQVVLDECDASMMRNDRFPAESCPQVKILDIEGFVDDEWVTLLKRFPGMKVLHVKYCSFEEIFPSHAPSLASFHNLIELKVFKCHQLLHLVTKLTAMSLVNLETLEISDCEKIEEIVTKESSEDVERGGIIFNGLKKLKLESLPRLKTEDFSIEDKTIGVGLRLLFDHNQVLLPKLEILELSNLVNNLISLIWKEQLLHNSFSNLKTLIVQSCGSLKCVPLHVLKSLNNLEKLQVSKCHMLDMVFGFEDLNDCKDMESTSVVVPLNLTNLEVKFCQGLTTLMTSSAARSLAHLTHLSIEYCNQMKEIITKQEGEDEEDMEIVFSKLEILELRCLTRLKRFCSHNYSFSFPLLEVVTIRNCPQLTMFCPGATHAPLLKRIQVGNLYGRHRDIWIWMTDLNDTIQLRFTIKEVISITESMALNAENITKIKEVFPKVEDLYVEGFMDEGITFPYSSLQRFPKLYSLYVEHCSFEEIFPSHHHTTNDFMEEIPPFKGLCIAHLDKLKRIWKDDSQHPPIHQNLTSLKVKSCCNLLKLAPSSASFKYLWEIKVSGCHQLMHLVTSSTAKSLVSLERLEINDCKNMDEIVMNETTEDVEGGITFNRLRSIQLVDMLGLKMFSSQSYTFKFPKLEELAITGCPKMNKFYPGVLKTPKLSKVKIKEHDMAWKDEEDLNKTINMLSLAKGDVVNV